MKKENREIIDSKKLKVIFNYISTLNNSKQVDLMFRFSYQGLRLCNWYKLQLKDILNAKNEIVDCLILNGEKNKGDKTATYYLSQDLKDRIKKYISGWDLSNKERYLFVSPKTNKPYQKNSLSNLFHKIYSDLGIENCSTHLGRRTFITELLTNGIDIVSVKTLVNHSSINTTTLYYQENPNFLKNIVDNNVIK